MAVITSAAPVVLIAVGKDHSLENVLEGRRYAVVTVPTGAEAVDRAHDIAPDTIILDAELPDMSAIDVCRMLHGDPRIGYNVPILIVAPERPSPDQRVTALSAGAWDLLHVDGSRADLSLRLETYVQAKRSIDAALGGGLIDPATGLHNLPGLARRARELGALMVRMHGGFACIVIELTGQYAHPRAGHLVVRNSRVSDVVGVLAPTEFAVLAPATDHAGALALAHRLTGVLRAAFTDGESVSSDSRLHVGLDAVANLRYAPIDPIEFLARAAAAVRNGKPEPGHPWLRRFAAGTVPSSSSTTPQHAPFGVVS
jgi:PleD family two-component response regulator